MGCLEQGKTRFSIHPTVANMGYLKQKNDWVPHPPHSLKHGLSEAGEGLGSPFTPQLQTLVVWSRGRLGFPSTPQLKNMGCLKQGKDCVSHLPHSCKHGLSEAGEGLGSPSTHSCKHGLTEAGEGLGSPSTHSCKHGLSEEGEGLCSPSTLQLQTWVVWSRGRTGFPIVPTVANMGCLKQGKDWVPRIPHSCKHGLSGTGEGMCSPSTPQLQTWVVCSMGTTVFPLSQTWVVWSRGRNVSDEGQVVVVRQERREGCT